MGLSLTPIYCYVFFLSREERDRAPVWPTVLAIAFVNTFNILNDDKTNVLLLH